MFSKGNHPQMAGRFRLVWLVKYIVIYPDLVFFVLPSIRGSLNPSLLERTLFGTTYQFFKHIVSNIFHAYYGVIW